MGRSHPYHKLPRRAFWRTSVERSAQAQTPLADLWRPKFGITPHDPIMTLGSCFAQHISRALVGAGFEWVEAERAPFGLSEETARSLGYGLFSARTGNIYTTRMLAQWLSWTISPESQDRDVWGGDGAFFDPARPQVEPEGFEDENELFDARRATLAALKRAIEKASVFVFTLGLTECWQNKNTGLVYSSCPGTVKGDFDDVSHQFANLTYNDVVEDLVRIRGFVKNLNPEIRMLLTVSPVPLVATAADGQHVLTATTYSKSVLRAAAGDFCDAHQDVDYFPSYELVTNPFLNRQMFSDDRRSVRADAVEFVMQHFLAGLGVDGAQPKNMKGKIDEEIQQAVRNAQDADAVICEEIELNKFSKDL
ncbi:GSCFA domain-containing protein [Paracoccus sp. (in: a-proteobacteria)]|uniref:GSCFA domain-containing protein n=1 Tax=Paracoccus sp. TaxID=267 RepID=UPI0026E0C9B5|nr:GSCFA domain-containing protein [Paracoccus sp. (in: a-proteobacteria)]MDO5648008.1 GSCFA domain-containing protein [Paracoccus sp. (in: a-proteobacteria)]